MNSVKYFPNVIQYSSRVQNPFRTAFLGKNMDNKYLDKINKTLDKAIVPEFGRFEPINVIFDEEDESRFTITIKPEEADNKAKSAIFAYVNANTGKMIFTPKNFKDKKELEGYLKALSEEDIDHIKRELRKKTEG